MHIAIPEIFKSYNMIQTFGEHSRPHLYYNSLLAIGSGKAADCIGCRACEAACPQHIAIVETLAKASALLDK
jgi:predicted aldo/keto reductase-like oxidoreductase